MEGKFVTDETQGRQPLRESEQKFCWLVENVNGASGITERKRVEELVFNIVQGGSAATGKKFFRTLIGHLGGALDADYAFIGQLKANPAPRIRTLAVYAGDQSLENFEYDLALTPGENEVEKPLVFPNSSLGAKDISRVPAQFLPTQWLAEMRIEGYAGTPLFNSTGQTLGIMAVLYRRPNPKLEEAESLLKIFAAYVTVHLEHWQMAEALRESEERFSRFSKAASLLNRIIAASAAIPSKDQETILEVACRELTLAFNLPYAAATLLDKTKMTATVVAEYATEERLATLPQAKPVADDPLCQYLLSRKTPLVTGETRNDPDLSLIYSYLRQRDMASLLLVPLMIEGEVVGGLGLEALEPHRFSTEEINLTWSVADQLAGVLARVQLEEERRQLEEQYHHAQKMEAIGRLTAGVAHDFNNLLTAINGFTSLIQAELQPDDPLQEIVGTILRSGQRAAGLVRQLMAFSRKQVIQPEVLNLNMVLAEMDNMLQWVVGEDIAVKTILAPDLWLVTLDPSQIEQVLVNLVVNARDAMPTGGQLTIETANVIIDGNYVAGHLGTRPGRYILLAVSDTGCGMSDAVKARIFEPFFTTKEVGQGTGLGLATVFGIVKQSGGNIWVYSEEGVGTTFKIYLPCIEETMLFPVHPEIGPETPFGNETILLVEDDAEVRESLRQVLRKLGYTLLEAQNGHDALRLIAHHPGPIHVLLTDVVMPGMSGKVLAEELANIRPEVKALFMSGYTNEAIVQHGVLKPGLTLLQKPFSPTVLARKLRSLLDN
jgi:signal transduction histidine kinase